MSVYKVSMFVNGTDEDAISLRKSLAQSICDEYQLNAVFGVSVKRDAPIDEEPIRYDDKEALHEIHN